MSNTEAWYSRLNGKHYAMNASAYYEVEASQVLHPSWDVVEGDKILTDPLSKLCVVQIKFQVGLQFADVVRAN